MLLYDTKTKKKKQENGQSIFRKIFLIYQITKDLLKLKEMVPENLKKISNKKNYLL